MDILIIEGKKEMGTDVKDESLSFANFIYSENYFLTTFDLWLLVQKYEIPTLFISQKNILQTNYDSHVFLGYGNRDDDFCFIIIPGFRPENIPTFKMVESNTKDVFISLKNIKNDECMERIVQSLDNTITIENYLLQFTKQKTTTYHRKDPKKLIIENDSQEKKDEEQKEQQKEEQKEQQKEEQKEEQKEQQKVKKVLKSKKPVIIEKDEDLSPISEEFIIQPKKSRKKKIVLKGQQTKKNKKKILIIETESETK